MTDSNMHLSLVIPTLNELDRARFLAARVRGLLPGLDVEAIIVSPAAPGANSSDTQIRYVSDSGRGVYAAYTQGLRVARGEYVWFMGDDDYPLDGVTSLAHHLQSGSVDLLVAPVVLSSGHVYRQRRSVLLLHFMNWCQQGVIYRRRVLARHRFFRRLTVQADQYVNILLRSDPAVRVVFTTRPICVFGADGISSRARDKGYPSVRLPLAHRTLGGVEFLLFRLLAVAQPLIKRLLARRLVGREGP